MTLPHSLNVRIMLVAIGAAVVIVAVTLSSILQDRARTLQSSENHAQNLALTMAEHAARSLDAVDLTLLSIKEQFERDLRSTPRGEKEIVGGFEKYIASLPQIRGLILTDKNGIIRYTERKKSMGMDVHDRKYFTVHEDRPDLGLFVGNPLKGRTTGRWFFSTSRRIADQNGDFGGIAMALVTQGYFAKVYQTTEIERNVSLAYTSKSGAVFAASPGFSDDRSDVAGKTVNLIAGGPDQGTYSASPFPNAKPRIVSHVVVPNLPIRIVASISVDTALAPWRERTIFLLSQVVAAFLVLAVLTFIASRHSRKREAAEAQLSEVFNLAPEALIVMDGEECVQRFNEGAERIFGYKAEEVIGQHFELLVPDRLRENYRARMSNFENSGKTYLSLEGRREIRGLRKDGSDFPASVSVSMLKSDEQAIITMILQDITDRLRSEEALRESARNFRAITENSPSPLLITRRSDGKILYANPKVGPVLGLSTEAVEGRDTGVFYTNPEQRAIMLESLEADEHVSDASVEMRRSDGALISTVFSSLIVNFAGEDAILSNFQDVTERLRLEEQLRQAQKMEAVGQLTGGVAHDFNNLLTIIMGNLEQLIQNAKGDQAISKFAENAIEATQRGANLTYRLLAFSRKQPLQPVVVDVNHLIRGLHDMLVRTLGENIEIDLVGAAGLWQCEVDPGQLENAILNLSINARDAMDQGGRLTIETSNARLDEAYVAEVGDINPGQYVLLAISDTGTGMSPGVIAKAFEPFFTTKEVGKGSGLGLSTIFGFVKQSGGHTRIYSEFGEGTTVKLYFPRSNAGVDEQPATFARINGDKALQGEVIMVVEDDPEVRAVAVRVLHAQGYEVLEAGEVDEALEQFTHGNIHLLLTDVILPGGLGGRELAEKACELITDLKVLYMSGYTENAIMHHGRLDAGMQLLVKPFRAVDLEVKVRAILDGMP